VLLLNKYEISSIFEYQVQNSGNCKKGGWCYGENGPVKFFETLADNVFRHNYSMMQNKKKNE
jgi:hypothetical protein